MHGLSALQAIILRLKRTKCHTTPKLPPNPNVSKWPPSGKPCMVIWLPKLIRDLIWNIILNKIFKEGQCVALTSLPHARTKKFIAISLFFKFSIYITEKISSTALETHLNPQAAKNLSTSKVPCWTVSRLTGPVLKWSSTFERYDRWLSKVYNIRFPTTLMWPYSGFFARISTDPEFAHCSQPLLNPSTFWFPKTHI